MKQELLPVIIIIIILLVIYMAMRIFNRKTKDKMKNRKYNWRR